MENGCVHIYCGDGKGKTTAAVGLAVRCAGGGGKVIYTSFLKDNTSGELNILRSIKNIELIENPSSMKFFGRMNSEEKAELAGLIQREWNIYVPFLKTAVIWLFLMKLWRH